MQSSISATILTKNSERTLKKTLTSLSFIDEIILLDNGSTDTTLEIAQTFSNVKIFTSEFIGFGALHNKASSFAKNDWILSIDSDEVITEELKHYLSHLQLNESCVYSFAFQNVLFGKKIRHSGWFPDRHVRLYNRKTTQFSDAEVHEKILYSHLKEIKRDEKIEHYSYLEMQDFLRKMQVYTDLFAKQNDGKPSSFFKALTHGWFAFFKTYFLKLGFLDGKEGYIIANYQKETAFYKYMKLWEKNKKC
jgi:glycosyltransferase involved in cell wall biosynthesis